MITVDVKKNSKISRYINLAKLLDFVEFNRLYFRQVDKYDDKLEGCFPKLIYGLSKDITITDKDGEPRKNGIIEQTKLRRKLNYVSCWTLSNPESMGMWNVYGGHEGLAIQTTVSLLKSELENAPKINHIKLKVSGIHYIDHSEEDLTLLKPAILDNPILLKNISYSYENEVRFIYDTVFPALHPRLGDGFLINVDAKKIIEKILVSPTAEQYFFDLVQKILSKYNLGDHVCWSSMRFPPFDETKFK